MRHRLPAIRRQRERGRADRAYVVIDGKRHHLGPWGSHEAERRYHELLAPAPDPEPAGVLQPPEPLPAKPMIVEVMAPFMEYIVERFANNDDEVWHYKAAMRVLKAEYGDLAADDFGPRRLRHLQDVMVRKGWSRKYVNGQVGRVQRMFRWAAADERLDASLHVALKTVEPLTRGRTTAPEPEPVKPVADAVVDATLPHLNQTAADMVQVQRLCGCRPGELCMMAAEFIDRDGPVWIYSPPKHKTQHKGKLRAITIGPRAQKILQKYLFSDGQFFPYDSAGYRQCVRRACEKAFPAPDGAEDEAIKAWNKAHRWRPNQLRHSVATKVRAEFGVEGAQHVLGHSRADVTQLYAQKNLEQAKAIALKMG